MNLLEPFEFEFLLNASSPDFERIVAPFVQNLERLGIRCVMRVWSSVAGGWPDRA